MDNHALHKNIHRGISIYGPIPLATDTGRSDFPRNQLDDWCEISLQSLGLWRETCIKLVTMIEHGLLNTSRVGASR